MISNIALLLSVRRCISDNAKITDTVNISSGLGLKFYTVQ